MILFQNRVDPAGWVGTRNGGACKQQTHENYLPFGYRFWCPLVSQTALNEGRNGKVLIHGANGCTLKAYKISYWAYLYNGSSRFYFVPDVEYTLDEVNACLRPNEDFHVYEAAESFVFGGCGTGTSWVKRPPAQGNSCEKQSLLSVPQDKCLQAGLSVGGIRDTSDSSYNIDGVRTHYYENMPSGCFIFTTDNIVNWNTKGIGGNDARGEMVCEDPFCPLSSYKFPVGISEENGRDVHGQLTSSGSGYVFKSYTEIQSEFSHCLSGFEDDADEQHEMTLECVKDTFYGQLEYGIQLVFGAQTSPGFVCGILESVKHQNKTLPGSCCLDAPYELSGDQWGHAYDCKSTCQRPGPYFGGLDEAACAAQGGTFCRNADDCSTLKDCVADNIIDAQNMDLFAYEQYLNASSSISDCGKLRNYFGFDEFFINEEAICEDVDQLKYSKDFDFLNEFFGQGSAGGSGGGDPTDIPPAPPELEVPQMAEFDVLDEVDTSKFGTLSRIRPVNILYPHSSI